MPLRQALMGRAASFWELTAGSLNSCTIALARVSAEPIRGSRGGPWRTTLTTRTTPTPIVTTRRSQRRSADELAD